MDFKRATADYSVKHYKLVAAVMMVFTLATASLIPLIKVDTDPENMLSPDESVRLFHNQAKAEFSLYDIVVVGIVNNKNPDGVFNPQSLSRIYELTEFARTLTWSSEKEENRQIGVVGVDILAPSTVDHIGQGGPGEIKFEWLMTRPPDTRDEAIEIRNKAMSNPLLKGTLVSEDGRAVCLYLPLTDKDLSYRIYTLLRDKIATFGGDEQYYITGLPVAEDTFGVEMFIQMAISAPLAMLVVFLLMLFFFRKLLLVVSPMIIAIVSVISTMGLLIGFGFPVHIMSSMIPIFLMPISVVDSVHILSEFFELYTREKGRDGTIKEVMGHLFTPMLYTSLTTAAGFASLALTPIPPVQVFGVFVAVGVMIAWVFTVTFVPAYVMLISEKSLENFGQAAVHVEKQSRLAKILRTTGQFTYTGAKPILAVAALITAVAVYGITRIQVNDNPVKWFSKRHPIRQADIELNKHFGGTYMAYLVLEQSPESKTNITDESEDAESLFTKPEMLEYVSKLQDYLKQSGLVGKSNSVADVVKKVHQELIDGKPENYIIPRTAPAVAQCLMQFQSSHNPDDLWHLVTYDYDKANIWLQLTSGDNQDMEKVVRTVDTFFTQNKPLVPLTYNWAGLTYINTVWQDKMVFGMLQSFLGSFLIVFIMMAVLFRSALWGLICMVPLTLTIVLIYGVIGLAGKDYDMPVAVLSALTLGMAVDFAIHFLERARVSCDRTGSWQTSAGEMFAEPARAITRNVLVIAIGFLPLLAAPLVPYKTVGVFMCVIMALSGIVTLIVLPAIIKLTEKTLFKPKQTVVSPGCNCGFCLIISAATVVLVALNLHQYWHLGLTRLTWLSIITIPVMVLVCGVMSRRQVCKNISKEGKRGVK
ncbi:MAG: MMPL family transporter [Sedimentisphaerales bacterium]|nr:MMPL family transporter [Sedimentisphaerales bacterium]